jgi:6,7-dimethyl-8-ribityllumazine synthase
MALDPKSTVRARSVRQGSVIGLVVSRFHEELTGAMLASAQKELRAAGVRDSDMHVVWAPGSFELPLLAKRLADKRGMDAVLCLGLVLKGETEHDRYVAEGAAHGLMHASLNTGVPLLFGVLTCATLEQARARALPVEAGGREDKGREVARSAIDTLLALDAIRELKI